MERRSFLLVAEEIGTTVRKRWSRHTVRDTKSTVLKLHRSKGKRE